MNTPIRIGLLGASKIARGAVMAPARADGRFVISAVAARDPSRARAYAEEHGIAAVADDYAALVTRDDVDVVYNALPPAGHARWTIAALEAGKPVLCEKPFARDAGEARAMVAAAQAASVPLLEAFHYRFHNVMLRAEALLRSGAIGALTGGGAEFHVAIPRTPGELRWSAEQGGGGLMDLGCYPVHALRTLFGAEPTIGSASAVFEDGVDSTSLRRAALSGRPARAHRLLDDADALFGLAAPRRREGPPRHHELPGPADGLPVHHHRRRPDRRASGRRADHLRRSVEPSARGDDGRSPRH